MSRTLFDIEVLTPEGEAFRGKITMLSTRTDVGSIGILANHQPLLAMLEPAELRLYASEDEIIRFAQGEGYLQVAQSHVMILLDEIVRPEELDIDELQSRLRAAADQHSSASKGSEQARLAKRDMTRCERFLAIAQADR